MSRMITWMAGLSLVIGMLLPSAASAAVVATNNDPDGTITTPADGAFRVFAEGGSTINQVTASDGNNVLAGVVLPTTGTSFWGYVWDLNVADYAAALGNPGGTMDLQNGWVVRSSVWLASDVNDPLLNEGTWTDSHKFEFATTFGGQGGAELFDTGDVFPQDFSPGDCDLGTGVCTSGTPISGTQWTQLSYQYEIDDFDFSGALDTLVEARPVLFFGDFTGGEAKQGTMYMDNIVIEVFADLATANATALPNNVPAGIPGNVSAPLAGDANNDGVVDLLDLDILGTNFGASPATFAQGDFNADDVVDLLDLDILGTNFGAVSSSAVPEPASIGLALLAGLALVGARRQRS